MPPLSAFWFLSLALAVASPFGADLARVEYLLDAGRVHEAESLFSAGSGHAERGSLARHRREILAARLAAVQGNWKKTDARLRAWKNSGERGEGSGEVLFWLGWSALHQGRKPEADSLFLLASAYVDEGSSRARAARGSQEALEYRFAALLESGPVLLSYLRGLPESPLPDSMRLSALERLPPSSRLYPHGQWQRALLLEVLGDTVRSREILASLATDLSVLPGRKAAARLNYLREGAARDSARTGYEGLLLKQQQGVSSEFARKRLQNLR
jgi:hypothetical protein